MASPKVRAFRSRLVYPLILGAAAVVRRTSLPRLRAIGRRLGALGWHVARGERNKAIRHLSLAFPDWSPAQSRATARAMFEHLGTALLEIFWLTGSDDATRNAATQFHGIEPVIDLMKAGRGVVVFTAHCGNWEWLAYCTGKLGYPVSVMQRERNEAEMNRFITAVRADAGIHTIDRGSTGASREMFQAIKRGGILAFVVDQNIRAQSTRVPFFGRAALTPIGPAKLAIRSGAVVVTAVARRDENGVHHLYFAEPRETSRDDDPVALTARVTSDIEEQIRRVPEQWVWMHERWRERTGFAIEGD